MKPQIIFFDLDDTLIHCNKYFEKTMHHFANVLAHWFHLYHLNYEDIREVQHRLDMKAVQENGFMRDHFPQSFIKTYHHFSRKFGRLTDRREILQLWELGDSVYHQDFEAYPHMTETLLALQQQGHELHLYTGGQHDVQNRKVEKLGLYPFFEDRIYVARKKVTSFLESILSDYGFDRTRTWMIGNSLRTDILPALETGIHAIFIPAEMEWEYNIVDINVEPQGAFLKLPSLQDVPPAITNYVSGNQL
jgi:putative hydrolase of the HAD superfamily